MPNIQFVHPVNDDTITIGENQSIAKYWNVPFIEVPSAVPQGTRTFWGDDVNHDFLSKDLMIAATTYFSDFLDSCHKKEKKKISSKADKGKKKEKQ